MPLPAEFDMQKKMTLTVKHGDGEEYSSSFIGHISGTPENFSINFNTKSDEDFYDYELKYRDSKILLLRFGKNPMSLYVKQGIIAKSKINTPYGDVYIDFFGKKIEAILDEKLNGTVHCIYVSDADKENEDTHDFFFEIGE